MILLLLLVVVVVTVLLLLQLLCSGPEDGPHRSNKQTTNDKHTISTDIN